MKTCLKVEYDKTCLCWSFYRFMVDNLLGERDSFIIAYGLNSEYALKVAETEKVEIFEDDKYMFEIENDVSKTEGEEK